MAGCKITQLGKRRDGKPRFWCTEHRASASGKYGVKLQECSRANDLPILDSQKFHLMEDEFPGGIALWGAVPAVYDTTNIPIDQGIHVHGRIKSRKKKELDKTFRQVTIDIKDLFGHSALIGEEDAIYYMVASIFELELKEVLCSHCNYSHLDKDVLSVKPHRKHLCAACGRDFFDSDLGIGNPIVALQSRLFGKPLKSNLKKSSKILDIKQSEFPGGIQLWGANQAFFWTNKAEEEDGIHIHGYDEKDNKVVDDTFGEVTIDGMKLDSKQVKYLMAQMALPHLRENVISLDCQKCGHSHFDIGRFAYTLHISHKCMNCGSVFSTKNRVKRSISNPILAKLDKLQASAPRESKARYTKLHREG